MINLAPVVSFVCTILFSIYISFSTVELIYFLPIIYVLYCEYKNIFAIFKRLILLNLFIIMIFIVLLLQTSFQEASNVYIRTNMIILFNLALFYRSNGFDIVRALSDLRASKKVVSSVYFTLKMIQVLNNELKNMRMTLRSRGFKSRSSFFTYETYGNLFGHIFVKSIKKAQALEESFKLRGFHGKIYLLDSEKLSYYDVVLILLVCMIYVKGFVI